MGLTLKDTDRGYAALVARVFAAAKEKPTISVGLLEGDGAQPHGEKDVDEAVTVLQVAIWNHFGTDNIPARPFITAWFDESESALRADLVVLMQSVVRGERTSAQILELMGQRCVAQIQARMAEGVPPPNAPSTIKAKGSSTPLVNEGILRSSVSYRVEGG